MTLAVQTSYAETISKAVAGMRANMTNWNADTRVCESASIGFGVAVSKGTADKGCVLGGGSAAVFVGISVRDITLIHPAATVDKYIQYENMAVMTQGDIWVTVGGDVADGEDVTFNSTTGVLSSTATGGSQFAIAGARWMTTAASGGLAVVRLSGSLPSA